MLDAPARRVLAPVLDGAAVHLARRGVRPNHLTVLGLVLALSASALATQATWKPAAALWLLSRIPDGLDGAVARFLASPQARAQGLAPHDRELGGYLDIVADFFAYGAFVVGCGIGAPDARAATLVLMLTYYVNGTAFLAMSSLAEKHQLDVDESGRTMRFLGGLTEGTETIAVHTAMALFPSVLGTIAWVFAGAVAITAVQRVVFSSRVLRELSGRPPD